MIERPWVIWFSSGDKAGSCSVKGCPFRFHFGFRCHVKSTPSPAFAREIRQSFKSFFRATEMINQVSKGRRSDILAANEPQPVEALPIGKLKWRVADICIC